MLEAWADDAAVDHESLMALINDLTDPDDCWYDHHGYCQAHYWFETEPACPHKRAKRLLEALRGE